MKKYFYNDGSQEYGPFTLEELKLKNITRETMIWFQGMDKWEPAGKVRELDDVFKFVPPSVSQPASSSEILKNQQPPKTWLLESILVTLFCCLPFGIIGIINAAKIESRFYAGDIEAANRYSADAKKWTKVGFWAGLVFVAIYMVVMLIAFIAGDYF